MDITEHLVDAQEMHRMYPQTFDVPSAEMLANVQPGWVAKICDDEQRFWTTVVSADDAFLTATVDNHTGREDRGYGADATVKFERRHVYILRTPKQDAMQEHALSDGHRAAPRATPKQQALRAMVTYVPKHWKKDKDMFRQGARTAKEALGMPADPNKILAHFRSQPALLQRAGLRADDIGIAYVASHDVIRREAGGGDCEEAVDAAYHLLINMSVESTLVCTATND